jgi:hypothetical protein
MFCKDWGAIKGQSESCWLGVGVDWASSEVLSSASKHGQALSGAVLYLRGMSSSGTEGSKDPTAIGILHDGSSPKEQRLRQWDEGYIQPSNHTCRQPAHRDPYDY